MHDLIMFVVSCFHRYSGSREESSTWSYGILFTSDVLEALPILVMKILGSSPALYL